MMSDSSRRRGAARARLTALYLAAAGLCAMMVGWVAFAPGSCTVSRLAAAAAGGRGAAAYDGFLDMAARSVPATLITKYRAHPAVCAAHVLPSALWSVLAPLQLHPGLRKLYPRMHRLSGRVLIATALLMSGGYALIHKRTLHFHAHDFPSLAQGEALSLVIPGLWEWLGGGWRGTGGSGSGSAGGGSAAAVSAFLVYEHCAIVWFAVTAVMTWWSAWWGSRSARLARLTAGTSGGGGGGGWVVAHRAWAVRHIAAGLSVAAQRVIIFSAHGVCRAAAATTFEPFTDIDGSFCSSPRIQKGIFADSLVVGTALCVVVAEVAVRDMRILCGGPTGGGRGGRGAGAPVGLPKRD